MVVGVIEVLEETEACWVVEEDVTAVVVGRVDVDELDETVELLELDEVGMEVYNGNMNMNVKWQ